MTPTLDIILVNWNAGHQLRTCLDSVAAARREGFDLGRVVVVDNASSDGSADGLDDLPLPLTVIRCPKNRGFAAGCNRGAAGSRADYLLLLNPDTRLLPDSLAVPLAYMEHNPQAGIAGVQLVNEDGSVKVSCACFPTPRRLYGQMIGLQYLLPGIFPDHFLPAAEHHHTHEVDQVMGAFFLVRRDLYEALGGMDERFFMYFEELDFSLRARQAGGRTVFLAEARAYHRGGGATEQVKARRLFYMLRSRIQYAQKHFSRAAVLGIILVTLLVEPFSRTGYALLKRRPAQVLETIKAYALLWVHLPALLVRR